MDYSKVKSVDGNLFESLIYSGVARLNENVKTVNELNVFPIPDGDTGDNMLHTITGGYEKMKCISDNDVGKKSRALSDGMLLNARGNSGVILSQLFSGIANGMNGAETVDISMLARAFVEGVKTAYHAVVQPVEGTILTVARESFEYAAANVEPESSLSSFFKDVLQKMRVSLENTPNLLAVLKEAGVIDSGGAGLYYIIDGMQSAVKGEELSFEGHESKTADVDFSLFNEDSVMKFGYCTEFLLQLQRAKCDVDDFDINVIIDYLGAIVDSIVCFKTGTIVKTHVHTMTPHKVLEFCQQFGEFLTIKIENMTLQHNETIKEKEAAFTRVERARKPFAVVTVATGKGIIDMFTEFGADYVIDGGQGNNPSAEDFIKAFDEVAADDIFVLPNNGNIILTAKQAAKMYEKSTVHVIESKNIGECYSALSMLDYSSGDPEVIAANLRNDLEGVETGMVTVSVRDAVLNGVKIEKGNYIGFTDKTMCASSPDKVETLSLLCKKLNFFDNNFMIVIYGEDVSEDDKARVKERIADKKDLEFYEIDGGQKVYDFILISE
ncbi:MAG: DAK2 domain-containing protein [Clostridia bacterium]|nr:DAK2 domain-containing protein [Clostridia bacterium]